MLYKIYKMLDYKQQMMKEMVKDDSFFNTALNIKLRFFGQK